MDSVTYYWRTWWAGCLLFIYEYHLWWPLALGASRRFSLAWRPVCRCYRNSDSKETHEWLDAISPENISGNVDVVVAWIIYSRYFSWRASSPLDYASRTEVPAWIGERVEFQTFQCTLWVSVCSSLAASLEMREVASSDRWKWEQSQVQWCWRLEVLTRRILWKILDISNISNICKKCYYLNK